jgi:hypothetical protein
MRLPPSDVLLLSWVQVGSTTGEIFAAIGHLGVGETDSESGLLESRSWAYYCPYGIVGWCPSRAAAAVVLFVCPSVSGVLIAHGGQNAANALAWSACVC